MRDPGESPALRRLFAKAAAGGAAADGLVLPAYDGDSLLRLPATVGSLLGVDEGFRTPPLDVVSRAGGPGSGVRRVVLFLLDGIGERRLASQLRRDDGGFGDLLARYGGEHHVVTTLSPSTTSVATTVLHGNGAAPAELGTLGFSQRLPHLGVVANMLFWRPAGHAQARNGELEAWGLTPETFLPTPSLYHLLAPAGVRTHAFLPHDIAHSPLSRMQLRGTEVTGYVGWIDMFTQVAGFLAADDRTPAYAYAYLPDFDGISHRDGPDGPSWEPLFFAVMAGLRRFLDGLPSTARDGTLVMLSADHGHAGTPAAGKRVIQELPRTLAAMGMREAGEPRHTFLHARSGTKEALLEAARAELGASFLGVDGLEALAAGLYGDPRYLHPEAETRVGDVVVLARGNASLWNAADRVTLLGMHGALDSEEMLVPLVVLRADA